MQLEHFVLNPSGRWKSAAQSLPDANLVFYFGPTARIGEPDIYGSLRARYTRAVIVGASAGSQIQQDLVDDDAIVGVAIRFRATDVLGVSETINDGEDSAACGVRLANSLKSPGLAAVLVLSDGLNVNGTQLIDGLSSVLGDSVPISGGLAGDGPRFARTLVGIDGVPASHRVVAIGLIGSSLRVSHAAVGGWDTFGPPRRVTSSRGNQLIELDGKPALDLYERYLGDEAAGLPGTALLYPLKVWDPTAPEQAVVRTVLSVDAQRRSMTFAGDLPQGWHAQLMRGNHQRLIDGAEDAATLAVGGLGADVTGERLALLISCVGRRLLMGQRTAEEIEAVRSAFGPSTSNLGFYSYGELAPKDNSAGCVLHNQTMTVTMLAEAVA